MYRVVCLSNNIHWLSFNIIAHFVSLSVTMNIFYDEMLKINGNVTVMFGSNIRLLKFLALYHQSLYYMTMSVFIYSSFAVPEPNSAWVFRQLLKPNCVLPKCLLFFLWSCVNITWFYTIKKFCFNKDISPFY